MAAAEIRRFPGMERLHCSETDAVAVEKLVAAACTSAPVTAPFAWSFLLQQARAEQAQTQQHVPPAWSRRAAREGACEGTDVRAAEGGQGGHGWAPAALVQGKASHAGGVEKKAAKQTPPGGCRSQLAPAAVVLVWPNGCTAALMSVMTTPILLTA